MSGKNKKEYNCLWCGAHICICPGGDLWAGEREFWRAHCQDCDWEIGPYESKDEVLKWLERLYEEKNS